jgi:hypothetical protein
MILMYFMYYVILSAEIIFMYDIPLWYMSNSDEVQVVSHNCVCSIFILATCFGFSGKLSSGKLKNTQRRTI